MRIPVDHIPSPLCHAHGEINWQDILLETGGYSMSEKFLYRLGHHAVRFHTRHIVGMDTAFMHPLPDGPMIIAANHPTTTDPFYLLALSRQPVSLLITEMAFKAPIFGQYLQSAGHIRVVKTNGRAAFDEALARLRDGQSIAIFPEGSLSPREGSCAPPRTGAARLALLADAPVVPVGIYADPGHIRYVDTTIKDMSATARWFLRGPYAMTVGDAMRFSATVDDWDSVRAISERIMRRIGQLAYESELRVCGCTAPAPAFAAQGLPAD